jgi:hypothetical protein
MNVLYNFLEDVGLFFSYNLGLFDELTMHDMK